MNAKLKRRLAVVTGVIIIVVIVVLAVVGGSTSAKSVTVAEALSGQYVNARVKVSGNVVDNSYYTEDNVLVFDIYDADASSADKLTVRFDGGVSSTFGNGVTAICTGKITEDGVLEASELITKCPSKYENASSALSVSELLDYGSDIQDKTVKITGMVQEGSVSDATAEVRFVLQDTSDEQTSISICYDGALSDEVGGGAMVVITGALQQDGTFLATEVALEG